MMMSAITGYSYRAMIMEQPLQEESLGDASKLVEIELREGFAAKRPL